MNTLKNYLDSEQLQNIQHFQRLQLKAMRKALNDHLGENACLCPECFIPGWKICPYKKGGHLVSLFDADQVGAEITFKDSNGVVHRRRIPYKNL